MADVTISQLAQGIPSGDNLLPYSTGSNTLGVPVSAIFQNYAGNIGIGITPQPLKGQLQIQGSGNDIIVGNMTRIAGNVNTGFIGANTYYDGASYKSLLENRYSGEMGFDALNGVWYFKSTSSTTPANTTIGTLSDKLTINASGAVSKPLQPFIYVSRRNAGSYNYTAGNNSGNVTPVIYTFKEQQIGDGSYNTSTGRYTAPATGIYIVEAGVNSSNGPVTQMWAVKNGVRLQTFGASSYSSNVTFGFTQVYLVKDDTFNISLFTPGINSLTIEENNYHTFMRITFLG